MAKRTGLEETDADEVAMAQRAASTKGSKNTKRQQATIVSCCKVRRQSQSVPIDTSRVLLIARNPMLANAILGIGRVGVGRVSD